MEKIMLTRSLEDITTHLDYGRDVDLDTFISKLEMYGDTYASNGYTNLKIDITKYKWDDDLEINLKGQSLETDKELEERLFKEDREKQYEKDKNDRKLRYEIDEYVRIKRKFGG